VDLLDVTILALRIALVAVLYAFLLVVLRAAGRGVQAARPVRSTAPPSNVGLQLIVLDAASSGMTAGHVIDVSDGATLGRAERSEVVVADSAVSAQHARVTRIGRVWVVFDLGSTNGTLVNDSRVNSQTQLNHGDVLTLGGVRLKVALRSSSSSAEQH
jgi:predicted component of type VI protein secretion system